jgi:hypothetical protein
MWQRVPSDISEDGFIPSFFEALRRDQETIGLPLPTRLGLGLVFVFPNIALINNWGNTMLYRFRPDREDPERCTWEIWSLTLTNDVEHLRPELSHLRSQRELPAIYAQDAGNMERQQRGLRNGGFDAMAYSPGHERLIPNLHRHLDRFVFGNSR